MTLIFDEIYRTIIGYAHPETAEMLTNITGINANPMTIAIANAAGGLNFRASQAENPTSGVAVSVVSTTPPALGV